MTLFIIEAKTWHTKEMFEKALKDINCRVREVEE